MGVYYHLCNLKQTELWRVTHNHSMLIIRLGSKHLLSSLILFALNTDWSYIITSFFIVCTMSTITIWELENKYCNNYIYFFKCKYLENTWTSIIQTHWKVTLIMLSICLTMIETSGIHVQDHAINIALNCFNVRGRQNNGNTRKLNRICLMWIEKITKCMFSLLFFSSDVTVVN